MTTARSLALLAARKLLSRLPLPLVTPVELQRTAPYPNPKGLAFKRIALVGRGTTEAQKLSDHLQELGARVEVGPAGEPADGVVAVLAERSGLDDLVGLHSTLAARLSSLSQRGRVLILVRSGSPVALGGVHAFVRSLARELGRKGTTVNAVLAEDLAAASPIVGFLASDRASYISGQSLVLLPGAAPARAASTPMLALVTGASRGLGAATAKVLAASGYRLALLDREEQAEQGQALCDALGGEPAGMAFFACDVRDDAGVEKALERARSLSPLGVFDVVVNNAGICRDRTFLKMKPEEWNDVLAVDLCALMHVTRRVLPRLAPAGRIINVASVSGLAGNFGQTNYSAAKGGVLGFTAQAAKELEPRGVCVTAVAPGLIDTAMTEAIPPLQREIAKQMISLAQSGIPDDVALAVEFLARREAWPLRGQALRVDGGMFFGP